MLSAKDVSSYPLLARFYILFVLAEVGTLYYIYIYILLLIIASKN